MATSDKITEDDVSVKGVFKHPIESGKQLLEVLDELKEGFKEILKINKEFLQGAGGKGRTSQELKEIMNALRESKAVRENLADIEKKRLKLIEQNEKAEQERLKTEKIKLDVSKKQYDLDKKRAADLARQAKEAKALFGEYAKGVKRLADVKKQLKELEFTGRTNGKLYKALGQEFQTLNEKVRNAEEGVGEFQRNVGNYREAIRLAIGQTGIFDSSIARLGQSLITLRKNQDKTASSTKNFTQLLKLAGIGLAIAAVGALIATMKKGAELSQSLADNFLAIQKGATAAAAATSSFRNAIDAAIAAGQYVKVLRETKSEVIKLREEVQKLILDEEDLNEIAADSTISFEQRSEALEKAFALRQKIARIEVQIAQEQLTAANKELSAAEVAVGVGNASLEIRERQLEAQLNFNEAIDRENDLIRINAQRQRQLDTDRAIAEIELLRSKRQNAKAAQQILENDLANEKKQLEERVKANQELFDLNKKTTDEEIKIFKEKIKVQFDGNELIAIQDQTLLKQRLESIRTLAGNGLGEAAINELSKIIKTAQDDQIKFQENSLKLSEEQIKRDQRILEIRRETENISKEFDRFNLAKDIERELDVINKKEAEILESNNLFNGKMKKQREDFLKTVEEDETKLFLMNAEMLRRNAVDAIKAAENNISDEQVRAEEIKKIREKLDKDLDQLTRDRDQKDADRAKENLEFQKELARKQAEVITNQAKAVTDAFFEEINKRDEKRKESLDKEIDDREKNIEQQAALAERGLDNQLAFEIAKKEQAELRKKEIEEREAKRKERQQLAEAYWDAYIAELNQPNSNPATAALKALSGVLLAKGLGVALAGSFADGVENIKGPGHKRSDNLIMKTSPGESVVTADATAENPGMVTAMNKGYISDYVADVLIPKYELENSGYADDAPRMSDKSIANAMVLQEMRNVTQAIKEKPVQQIAVNEFMEVVEKRIMDNITKKITYKNTTKLG